VVGFTSSKEKPSQTKRKGSHCNDANELLGAKGAPLVGEEVRKRDVGKVGI